MQNKGNLIKGVFEYSISTWANFLIGILSVVITTRLLKPDVYGLITIFFSVSNVMMYVLTLGMDVAYIRFYNEPPGHDTNTQLLYKNIVISTIVCFFVGLFLTIGYGDKLAVVIFGVGGRVLIGLLFLYTFCNIVLRYLNISFRMSFRVFQYNFQNILTNCLSKILVIFAALFTDGFVWIATIFTIGLYAVLCIYFVTQRKEYVPYEQNKRLNLSLNLKGYSEYVRFALFSAPTYIVVYFNTYINQQLIRNIMSSYALGVFSSTVMFGSILSAVKGGFSTFWSAYVYQYYKEDSTRIGKVHDYIVIFAILAASALVIGRDIIYLFIGKDYHSSKAFFSLLLVLPVLTFLMETTDKGLYIVKKTHIGLIDHFLSVATNIICCIILIPSFGLMGAAIANAISALLLYCLNTFWGQKYYKTINNVNKSLIGTVLVILVLIIPVVFFDIKKIIIFVLFIDLIAILIYRNESVDLFQRFYKRIGNRKNQ